MTDRLPFVLGHGTANDFVLLPDHAGSRYGADLDPALVSALCDRRRGIGADGVIRVVRTADLHRLGGLPTSLADERAEWFMDYRNADGSSAEMCGNGIRVLAAHLARDGLAVADGPIPIGTRGGTVLVQMEADRTVSVDMGVPGEGLSGAAVTVSMGDWTGTGTGVAIPNPHAVVAVDDPDRLGPLAPDPVVAPAPLYPNGSNVEFVTRVGASHLRMRVWERGVGETQSCGTGVCAAAWVAMREDDAPAGRSYRVDVPGGTLTVTASGDGHLHLRGPAVVVADGWVDRDALAVSAANLR